MSSIGEAIKDLDSVEGELNSFLAYDSFVGGLISRGLKVISDAKGFLRNPTRENIQEALQLIQDIKMSFAPYAGSAPHMVDRVNQIIERLKAMC